MTGLKQPKCKKESSSLFCWFTTRSSRKKSSALIDFSKQFPGPNIS